MSKPKVIVIDLSPEGAASGMHFDGFPLGFLGKMQVARASEIVFNEHNQQWDIDLYGANESERFTIEGFPGYDLAREFEVDFVQLCRSQGESATGTFARSFAAGLQAKFLEKKCPGLPG